MSTQRVVIAIVLGLTVVRPASAQVRAWTDHGFANVNFASQSKGSSTATSLTFSLYEENGGLNVSNTIDGGSFVDVMAGARLWKNFGLAFQTNGRSETSDGTGTGSVPDPIAFGSPRAVETTVPGLTQTERWVSVAPVYVWPLTDKIHVMLFGGASVVKLERDTVGGVSVTEGPTAPVLTFTRTTLSRSVWGYIVGVDASFMFTPQIGVGAFARVQAATVHLPNDVTIDAGGGQAGGGVRVRF